MFRHAGMVLALGSIFALGSVMPPAWAHGTTERVSISSGDAQGNNPSFRPAISAGGRFVAFWSDASNLVPGDTNDAGSTSSSTTARRAKPSGSASAQAVPRVMTAA